MTVLKTMKVKKKMSNTKTDSSKMKTGRKKQTFKNKIPRKDKIEKAVSDGDKILKTKIHQTKINIDVKKSEPVANKLVDKSSKSVDIRSGSTAKQAKSVETDKQNKPPISKPAHQRKKKSRTKDKGKVITHGQNNSISMPAKKCSTSENNDNKEAKRKTPLTDRQKHKRKKLAEKRKARREMKKNKKGNTEGGKDDKTDLQVGSKSSENNGKDKTGDSSQPDQAKTERIILPKNIVEATCNWRKLQMTMKPASEGRTLKRKVDQIHLRNPKYRKVDDRSYTEKIIAEVNKPKKQEKCGEIWFDDVDEALVDEKTNNNQTDDKTSHKDGFQDDSKLVKPEAFKGLTKLVGMDCEMVGVRNNESVLARVSIVNRYGEPLYDKFVKPTEKVTDYRTSISGIRPEDLEKGEPFTKVRKEVADILKGRTLIGHALKNDLNVLRLGHPKCDIRDTSTYAPFRKLFHDKTPGLRKLTAKVLSVKIQHGEHSSIQDAQAAVRLYTLHKTQWENAIKKTAKNRKKKKKVVKTVLEKDNDEDQLEKIDRLWDV